MRQNYHTHTYRCKHADGSEEDYVKGAIRKDIEILGISDHGPFPHNKFGFRMDFSELPEYIRELNKLKTEYKDKLLLLAALEIEYLPREVKYYEKLLGHYSLDYLVLGQHIFCDKDKLINIYNAERTEIFIAYAHSLAEAMNTGYFKFIAHPDIMFINDFIWDIHCEKACDIIIEGAIRTDTALEFNANGIRRGKHLTLEGGRYFYPYHSFWNKVKETEIKVIINSDCHNPKELWDESVKKAYEIAENWNLNILWDKFCIKYIQSS